MCLGCDRSRPGTSTRRNGQPMSDFDERKIRAIGRPLRRKEDARLLTGRGRFTDDFAIEGQAYMAVVRSTVPHARLDRINVESAIEAPGVLGVLTGAEALADGLGPIPHNPLPKTRYDMRLTGPGGSEVFIGPHHVLAHDKVRFVGEAVAAVVAETRQQALDAAELVEIDHEPLPFVALAAEALASGAPAIWDDVPDNVLVDTQFGDNRRPMPHSPLLRMSSLQAFMSTVSPVCRSSHGRRWCVFDAHSGRYTLHAGSGGAVRQKIELAAVLGIDAEDLRVLSFDVGGNFGTRNRVYPEFALVLWAARKFGRPVKYTATRLEAFLSDYQGRDLITDVALALAADGRFLAMRAVNTSNVGSHCVSLSPLGKGSGLVTGPYDIPVAHLRSRAVFHEYGADAGLSQFGTSGSHVRDRAPHRKGGTRMRFRSNCAAPQEPRSPGPDALHQCRRVPLRQRHLRGQSRSRVASD